MNILVVDDKEENRKFLRQFLMARNYIVTEAVDGQQAIEMCMETKPDLVLMDIMMPGINGQQATTFIKNIKSDVYFPIIYVTALSAAEAMSDALEAGGDDFICKPVDVGILESKILAHLRIRKESFKLHEVNKKLELHNQRVQKEHDVVEDIFNRAIGKSYLDPRCLKYHISPVSVFNGDLLLVARKPDGGISVFVGDFTGHGLPAAMGTLPVVQVFYTMVSKGLAVEKIASELNRVLQMLLPVNMFCCANVLEMDEAASKVSVWAGGLPDSVMHNPNTGEVRYIKSACMPLGILDEKSFDASVAHFDVAAGEKIYLFTDGLTESRNKDGEEYGLDRVVNQITENSQDSFRSILLDHEKFVDPDMQGDDVTLIELNCNKLPPVEEW